MTTQHSNMRPQPSLPVVIQSRDDLAGLEKFSLAVSQFVSQLDLQCTAREYSPPRDARAQFNRTYNTIVLEAHVNVWVRGKTKLVELYTPFGGVRLLLDEGIDNETFLDTFDVVFEDVTDKLTRYDYSQACGKIQGPQPAQGEPWAGSCGTCKYYLVRRVGRLVLFDGAVPSEVPYFGTFFYACEQEDIELPLLSTLQWPLSSDKGPCTTSVKAGTAGLEGCQS